MNDRDLKILEILKEINSASDFENSDNFLMDGLIDSLDIIRLITLLETEFNISINATDIIPENFENIKTIGELIDSKG